MPNNLKEPALRALVKKAARAIENTARIMDAKRYAVPAHRRERYFGRGGQPGYKDRVLEAQALAVLKIFQATNGSGS